MPAAIVIAILVYRDKLLHSLADIYFAFEEVAVRVELRHMHPVELSALMATMAKRPGDLTAGTQDFPDHIVFAIRDQQVFLRGVVREGDTPHRAVAERCRTDEGFLEELAVSREDLIPIIHAIGDVDQTIL